jgi:hypothetical protein
MQYKEMNWLQFAQIHLICYADQNTIEEILMQVFM